MRSTGPGSRVVIRRPVPSCWWVSAALSTWLAFAPALAQDDPMPRPQQLERDVQFWIRVYTQIDTNAGFLHDQYNLSVIYDTLHFAPNTTPAERERQVDQARERYGGGPPIGKANARNPGTAKTRIPASASRKKKT